MPYQPIVDVEEQRYRVIVEEELNELGVNEEVVHIIEVENDYVQIISAPEVNLNGDNIAGQVTIPKGNYQTVISYVPQFTYVVQGFNGFGEGDTGFFLLIDGQIEGLFSTNALERNAIFSTKTPIKVKAGTTIKLDAVNNAIGDSLVQAVIQGQLVK